MLLKKYYVFYAVGIYILICFMFQNVTSLQGQTTQEKKSKEIANVAVNRKVLDLINSWDNKIWFFTSSANPITSLDSLNANEIACFGAEHWDRFIEFLDAAGIKYKEQFINLESPNLVKFDKNTRLYITWSDYESRLSGASRVLFVEKEEIALLRPDSDTLKLLVTNDVMNIVNSWNREYVMLIHKENPIKCIEDFKGREIFVFYGYGLTQNKAFEFIKTIGYNTDDITVAVQNNWEYYPKQFFENRKAVAFIAKIGAEILLKEPNVYQIEFYTKQYGQDITGTVTDIDGNVYQTVKIGNHWWIAENLKVTHYRNGDPIPNVTDNSEWTNLTKGAYCVYDNDESNADTYGYLYNWYAVDDSRNIAPKGWHVPTDEEWKELEMYLGMSQSEADDTGWRGTNEGSKLAGRADLWNDGNLENNVAFAESGYSALPAGSRDSFDGGFCYLGLLATFWSSTETNSLTAWFRVLGYGSSGVSRSYSNKHYGVSVRLIRD